MQGVEAHLAGLAGGHVAALLHRSSRMDDLLDRIRFHQVRFMAQWDGTVYSISRQEEPGDNQPQLVEMITSQQTDSVGKRISNERKR